MFLTPWRYAYGWTPDRSMDKIFPFFKSFYTSQVVSTRYLLEHVILLC